MKEIIDLLNKMKPGIDFENTQNLLESGILDSLEVVTLITEISEYFNIEIEPDDVDPDNFESAETIWNMVKKIISRKNYGEIF